MPILALNFSPLCRYTMIYVSIHSWRKTCSTFLPMFSDFKQNNIRQFTECFLCIHRFSTLLSECVRLRLKNYTVDVWLTCCGLCRMYVCMMMYYLWCMIRKMSSCLPNWLYHFVFSLLMRVFMLATITIPFLIYSVSIFCIFLIVANMLWT